MYRPGNPGNQNPNLQNRFNLSDSSSYSGDSCGGTPFRSPHQRPRYQSSPRYQPQFGSPCSPFPDPFRMPGGGGMRPQRSPRPSQSPRHDYNYPSPQGGGMDSPYHPDGWRMSTPMSGSGRGRGRHHYHSGGRDYSSPASGPSESNPGGSDNISLYYSPSMVENPWANLQPVPATHKS